MPSYPDSRRVYASVKDPEYTPRTRHLRHRTVVRRTDGRSNPRNITNRGICTTAAIAVLSSNALHGWAESRAPDKNRRARP